MINILIIAYSYKRMNFKISEILLLPKRKLVVSLDGINLHEASQKAIYNIIFVLMIEESTGAAGGRGGGSGNRKIDKILGFKIYSNKDEKIYETDNANDIEKFEIPYSAVAMDIILESGKPYVIQGIVDSEMIKGYLKLIQ